jgi:hypothetical protein
LVVFRTRPAKYKELVAIAILCGFVLFTWFGWSLAAYGLKPTFASNTSITPQMQYQGSNLAKIAGNVLDSIVPRIAYYPSQVHLYDQPYTPGMIRDNVFLFYQTNLIFSMGLIGGPLVVWSVIVAFRRRKGLGAERNFWLMLIAFSLLIGLAVVGERDYFGVAHLTLVPLELLGLTLLSARFFSRRLVAYLIVAGCAIDFSLGIFFHVHIQHLENTAQHTYFTGLSYDRGQFAVGAPGPDSLNISAWRNWFGKHHTAYIQKWLALGESYRPGDPTVDAARADLRAAVAEQLKEDDTLWHGWYRRHGGEITLFGDHFDGDAASVLLVLVAVGLLARMALLAKMTPQPADAPRLIAPAAVKPRSSRSPRKR